jgi:hypothetical protein
MILLLLFTLLLLLCLHHPTSRRAVANDNLSLGHYETRCQINDSNLTCSLSIMDELLLFQSVFHFVLSIIVFARIHFEAEQMANEEFGRHKSFFLNP